jgi:hypothetical protein
MESTMTRHEEFIARFRQREPGNDDEIDIYLAWLKENGPDEWHRWALAWNWDYGVELLEWIVAQPNCDKGTALDIYYAAQPDYFARFASVEEAAKASDPYLVAMMPKICEMWRDGAYPTYAYRPGGRAVEALAEGPDKMRALAAAVPWDVPDDLAAAELSGEPNEFERAIDGVPVEMLRALGEDW